MSRLIFFSGGVESTALLTMVKEDDILVTVNDIHSTRPTHNTQAVENISDYFGIDVHYFNIDIPKDISRTETSIHQMWLFISVANILVVINREITEICFGANKEEFMNLRPELYRIYDAWHILHPDVLFNHPLVHLSKQEQWDLIPDRVKPMVRTCLHNTNCGVCKKCLELKNLEGSVFDWHF